MSRAQGIGTKSSTLSPFEWERALEALEKTKDGDGHIIRNFIAAPETYLPDFSQPGSPFS